MRAKEVFRKIIEKIRENYSGVIKFTYIDKPELGEYINTIEIDDNIVVIKKPIDDIYEDIEIIKLDEITDEIAAQILMKIAFQNFIENSLD